MEYLHVDVASSQSSKRAGAACGDHFTVDRGVDGTLLLLADGLGSGIHAHLAARFVTARLRERILHGGSPRHAFATVVNELERSRGRDRLWAAITLARILPGGDATILSYESPEPLLLSSLRPMPLPLRPVPAAPPMLREGHVQLRPGDGLLLVSDGITQAGLGRRLAGMPQGWTLDGVARETALSLEDGSTYSELPELIRHRALALWEKAGDDCTAVAAWCRRGRTVSLMSGPPASPERDSDVVHRFLESGGVTVVCGATTAKILARETGRSLSVAQEPAGPFSPPGYEIEGIDLVTEGAVTLNQLYNVLDADSRELGRNTPVADLHALLKSADRVRIFLGTTVNPASLSIDYRQQGILQRGTLAPLIAEKLRETGKLVEIIPT